MKRINIPEDVVERPEKSACNKLCSSDLLISRKLLIYFSIFLFFMLPGIHIYAVIESATISKIIPTCDALFAVALYSAYCFVLIVLYFMQGVYRVVARILLSLFVLLYVFALSNLLLGQLLDYSSLFFYPVLSFIYVWCLVKQIKLTRLTMFFLALLILVYYVDNYNHFHNYSYDYAYDYSYSISLVEEFGYFILWILFFHFLHYINGNFIWKSIVMCNFIFLYIYLAFPLVGLVAYFIMMIFDVFGFTVTV